MVREGEGGRRRGGSLREDHVRARHFSLVCAATAGKGRESPGAHRSAPAAEPSRRRISDAQRSAAAVMPPPRALFCSPADPSRPARFARVTDNRHCRDKYSDHVINVSSPADRYVLFEAEDQGLDLPAACRMGCCTVCAVKARAPVLLAVACASSCQRSPCMLRVGARTTS